MHAKSLQSCPILCNPMDCRLPGSSVHRILQARIMEWDAMSSSRGSSRPRDRTHISYVSCICRRVFFFFFFFFLPLAPSRKPKDPLISVQSLSRVRLFATPWTRLLFATPPTRLLCSWASPGKNTGVGCHFLLQWIFRTQGLNLGLLHCRWILYQLSYEGRPC